MPRPTLRSSPIAAASRILTTTQYEVRPARADDRPTVTELIDTRLDALGRPVAIDLKVSRAALLNCLWEEASGEPLVWLLCKDTKIVGAAAVLPGAPSWAWGPIQHNTPPSRYIAALFTRPTPGVRLARLLTWFLLDRAARQPAEDDRVQWLRATTSSDQVMHYACAELGFSVSDGVRRGGRHIYLLQHAVREVPDLGRYVSAPRVA
ncbi:hypothetical protein AB0I22_19620 [Streptomyces sp. NPDC050610]|uniref:hypothetical protein n=1 Tax=Streptomyces sp. NPDC050610 TaxID=3157097 RepID=UPI0034180D69